MIVSGGELVLSESTPTFARSVFYPQTGIGLTNLFATYGAIYKAQLWVHVVVRKRANATRRLPLKVYNRSEDDGRVEARDTPYARLLREPNPRMSASLLWEWTSSTYDVYGEAIWLKVRGRDRKPAQLWPVHPSNVSTEIVTGARATEFAVPEGSLLYLYFSGVLAADPAFVIPEQDVVHFKTYSPDSVVRGMSPIEPLRQTLVNEDAARRASSAFWTNGGRPSGYLSHPKTLSADAMKRLKAEWDSVHSGVDNFGKWAILEEGMEPKPLSLTAEESQYIESRKLNREEVCAAYDMPPPAVHILDRATFSNITENLRSVYRDTMAPHLGGFESTMDFQLRPEFDSTGDLYAEFLMDQVLRGTLEERSTSIQAAINSGQMTPNEARALDNRPALPGGDRLFINSALIPIEDVSVRTAKTSPDDPTQDVTKSVDSAAQSKAIDRLWGRLGCYATLDDIEPGVLTAGLNGVGEQVRAELAAAQSDGASIGEFRERVRVLLSEGVSA